MFEKECFTAHSLNIFEFLKLEVITQELLRWQKVYMYFLSFVAGTQQYNIWNSEWHFGDDNLLFMQDFDISLHVLCIWTAT